MAGALLTVSKKAWWLAILLLGIDQAVSAAMLRFLPGSVPSAESRFFSALSPEAAVGAAWGILFLLWRFRTFPPLAFPFLAAGLASNTLSLVIVGRFVDYLPLGWWVTNLADLSVMGGIAGVVASSLHPARQEK